MSKKVICYYCNEPFDADNEPFEKVGVRYAHKECYDNRTLEDRLTEEFWSYVKTIFGVGYNYQKIKRQLDNFINKNNYSILGVLNSLKYWFDIKGNDVSKSNGGIGIVPYIYEEAQEYSLYLEQQQKKPIIPVSELTTQIVKSNKGFKKKKTLNFEE